MSNIKARKSILYSNVLYLLFSLQLVPHINSYINDPTLYVMNVNTKIAQAEQILSHVFTNKMLCAEAIQMAGPTAVFIVNRMFQQFDNNKRLAVLGDAVLSKVLCDLWYQARNSLGMANISFMLKTES